MNVDGERLPLWVNKPIWGRGSRDGKRAFCLGSSTSLKLHESPFCLYEIIRFAKVQTTALVYILSWIFLKYSTAKCHTKRAIQ